MRHKNFSCTRDVAKVTSSQKWAALKGLLFSFSVPQILHEQEGMFLQKKRPFCKNHCMCELWERGAFF